ncbi:hypothetical protein ACTA71_010239 [Dictyostelium dimigraforme]
MNNLSNWIIWYLQLQIGHLLMKMALDSKKHIQREYIFRDGNETRFEQIGKIRRKDNKVIDDDDQILPLGQDYTISNLNNINTFYPPATSVSYCDEYQNYFMVQKIKLNASSISSLSSENLNCYQILGNSTSSIFSCNSTLILNFSNYSSTLIVNSDPSKGSLVINYECKDYSNIKIEIIQEVTWSTSHKYSSIFKIDGLLDSTMIGIDNNGGYDDSFGLTYLGKGFYRILYYEGYFIPKITNISQWEIFLIINGTIIPVSTPYNITKFKNGNGQEEIEDLIQFPDDGQVIVSTLNIFGSLIKYRSTSSLQRPINSIVYNISSYNSNKLYSSSPRPISGSIGNMTYIGYFPKMLQQLTTFYLFKQFENSTFQKIPITTNYTVENLPILKYIEKFTNVDNSSSSMSLFSLQLSYSDFNFSYDSQYYYFSTNGFISNLLEYQVFPFGFSGGNNLNYNMTISVPTSGFSSDKIIFTMGSFLGSGPNLEVTPSHRVNDGVQETIIKSFETIYLNNFNYLIRFTISDSYGLNHLEITYYSYSVKFYLVENLVSGDIKNGIFELLCDTVKYDPNPNWFHLYNHIGKSTTFKLDQPYSISTPNLRINLPTIQLKSVEHLKDIKNISYMFNDVDITDKTVDNIMYFSFNNINNYKNLPIGLALMDPRTLQDTEFSPGVYSYYSIILESVYNFAIWDEQNSKFYIKFRIPANTSPGVLDWMLVFDRNNYLLNTQLPDEYQLRVISTKFDSYGPIVTNIIKYSNSNSTTVIGWLFTIEDEINGFKDGYITIKGSIDSSVYNITFSSSDMVIGSGNKWKGDYLISIPYILNDCISQNYSIYYALFTDTFGNRNKYYKIQTSIDSSHSIDSSFNPFINFLNDRSVLQVSTLGVCSKIDLTPPVLISFNASKSSIDVGSLDRSITFNFHSQDFEGLKDDQLPIVYITDSNSKIHQITSGIVSSNLTDIEYTCTIEVPIGFSHPYGFLISVYGFINRGGSYSGFSANQLKELGFSWFVETKSFSVSQPIITGSSGIDNDGGDLWLYGRGFKSINKITLSNIIETYSPSMTVLSESTILIKNVKPSNNSINMYLTNIHQPTIQSNTFIINPKIYAVSYPKPTPSPTQSSKPIPTNKPQNCIGNPVCGGSKQGYCKEDVGCICYSPFIGLDCTSKIISIQQPKPNLDKPTTLIENSNNGKNNYQVTGNISIIAIREVNSVTGEQVKIHYIDKWYYNNISSTISNYQSTILNNNISTTINATLEWFENKSNITFANQELIMNPSTIKYTVELSSYKFSNQLTNLQVIIEAQIQSNENDDICSGKEFGDTTLDNSNYIKLQVSSNSIYGRFLKRGIVDGKIVTITNELLDSKLSSISKENNVQSYIGIEIGQYQTSVIIDPDFSLLLDNRAIDPYSPNSICSTSSSTTSLTKGQLIGIIIGASLFFIILVIIIVKIIFIKSISFRAKNVTIFHQLYTTDTACMAKFFILIEGSNDLPPIQTLAGDNQSCYLLKGNSTSSIFMCNELTNLAFDIPRITTFKVNNNQALGTLTFSYECKKNQLSIDNIQDITWSTTHKYSSIVKINGLLDSTTIVFNGNDKKYSFTSLGKSYYRIHYFESYYIPKLSLSDFSKWEVNFNYVGTNITFSTPFNITKFNNKNEILEIKQYPTSNFTVNYNSFISSVLTFRSISSLQRPVNPMIVSNSFKYSNTPIPISGSIGNMTYITYIGVVISNSTQYNSLFSQNEDLTFKNISIDTIAKNINMNFLYDSFDNLEIDNSSISMFLYTLNLQYGGAQVYDFQYFGYSGDTISYKTYNSKCFPFGFSRGNNLKYNISISIPTRGESYQTFKFFMSDYNDKGPKASIVPIKRVSTSSLPSLISVEEIYITQFKYLIRLTVSDIYGINLIYTMVGNTIIKFGGEYLVSGDIKNGVFEVPFDAVKYGSPTPLCITNHIELQTFYYEDQPISTLNPNYFFYFPTIKLNSVNHLNDIRNIRFLENDIDIANKEVDNIIYFSFDNLNDYKTLPIGFTLIDPRTLRDLGFYSGYNSFDFITIFDPPYSFAVWDEQNSRFYIKFRIPANTSPGVLDWMLVFDRNNYLLNTQLPDEYQLRILSTNFDNYGPIVTSIIKYPTQAVLGWLFTIEDEINGFKDGYVTVRGSIDSSVYNITFSSSDLVIGGGGNKWKGDYLIKIPFISNDCVSQNYVITFAVFTDTFGNRNKYYRWRENSEGTIQQQSVDSSSNPFINFINDSSILEVSADDSLCGKTDSTPPSLTNFWASKISMDVGSLDRTITFKFSGQDLDGLMNDQYPIVYITDMNSRIYECISTIVSKNRTDIDYICTMEVPVGFSHPYGFLISVYGFINRGGSYSGFSSSELKKLGFNWFVETKAYSVSQPIITGSSGIDNDGGNLWLYGRGFNSVNLVSLSSLVNTYSLNISIISDSVVLIKDVLPTNISIIVQLSCTPQVIIQSNTFTIIPTVYNLNLPSTPTQTPTQTSTPTSTQTPTQTPTPTSTQTPTQTPTLTPTPTPTSTNKPQNCIGNPVCGGPEQGYCKEDAGCICYSPFIGLDCTSKIIIMPQPKPNEDKPTTIIENSNNNSSNVNNNYQVTSNISIIAIREVNSVTGEQVKIHYIDKWYYNRISSTISNYQSTILNNNISTTINATLEWFENKSNITFANQELIMNPSTIKYTVELSSYKFSNQLTNLQVIIEAQIQSNENDDICSGKEFGDTTLDNSNYIKLQVSSNSIYGRFLKRGIVDGKTVTITNELLDSKLNSISKENNVQSYIGIEIGQYQTSVIIDPDFSLLLDNQAVNSDSPNSICSSSSTSLTKGQLAGIIIGATLFFIVIVLVIIKILLAKSFGFKVFVYKTFRKSKS